MSPASNRKRILIVDDTPEILQVLAMTLQYEGYEVETAVDGVDGLQRFREKDWDLVITDMQMPRLNGEEMTAAIKAIAPTIPVIMVTGSSGIVHKPDVFFAFIAKPFRGSDILSLVDRALQPKKPGGE